MFLWSCGSADIADITEETGEIEERAENMEILAFSLGANCYLVYGENSKKACLIDAPEYDGEIMDAILSKGLSLEYIILTHGHFDHILGAEAFKEKTGAKIAVHELETEYLGDPEKSMTYFFGGGTVAADVEFKDGDILSFGGVSLEVLHTPGHTKGSCFLICDNEKIMFSGDTLFKDNIGRFDFYGGDYGVLMESLQKLKSMEGGYTIYPGHGEATTLKDEIKTNPYMR